MHMNFQWLSAREARRLFWSGSGHIPVAMKPLPDARVIWMNRRVMRDDPAWLESGGTETAYERHLLDVCAWTAAAGGVWLGHADRYGGFGIGNNGGSGRAVVLGDYHVKGIGCTPLIGLGTDAAHATGGAYLEECVRETILAEIAALEFPHGAIPTLAIIDTGETEVWQTAEGPKSERRCLLVRPAFVRPAHFERAETFRSNDAAEGLRDRQRVRSMFDAASAIWGRTELKDAYLQFWPRWSEQLAYGFAHRLPHSAHTTSNVCLGGQLLDFGAMVALPTWSRYDVTWSGETAGAEMDVVKRSLLAQLPQWARDLDDSLGADESLPRMLLSAHEAYSQALRVQMLRVMGLTADSAQSALSSSLGAELTRELARVLRHAQRERIAIFAGTPESPRSWDVSEFWSETAPTLLSKLRELIERVVGDASANDAAKDAAIVAARGRVAMRTKARRGLYRETVKRSIYDRLERAELSHHGLTRAVGRLIQSEVSINRRDSREERPYLRPVGFAVGDDTTYSIHENVLTRERLAFREGMESGRQEGRRIACLDGSGIRLANASRDYLPATVTLLDAE